jgi:hypothetical protein
MNRKVHVRFGGGRLEKYQMESLYLATRWPPTRCLRAVVVWLHTV